MGRRHVLTRRKRRDQRHQRESRGREVRPDPASGEILRTRHPHSRLRKYFSGRTHREPQFLQPHHDPAGIGLPRGRSSFDCDLQRKRRQQTRRTVRTAASAKAKKLILAAALPLIFVCSLSCARPKNPQVVFDHALQTFRHGDVSAAEEEAKQGYEQFHSLSAEWAWKFRILEANALAWRGMNDQAMALLDSDATPPPSSDLAVQRQRLQGVAYISSQRFEEADKKLSEADRLCAITGTPGCASVILDRGELELARGHFTQGQRFFEHTLEIAHARADAFLEA